MKKTVTWYLLALAALNVLLAQGTAYAVERWNTGSWGMDDNGPTPPLWLPQFYLQLWWWPYLFAGLAAAFGLLLAGARISERVAYHFIITTLMLECLILFVVQISFILPFSGTVH